MIVRFATYMPRFYCLADKCPDTCCQGWKVPVDPKTLRRYQAEKGPLKRLLKRGVDFSAKSLIFQDGVCPFLNQGLCRLQIERGAGMLCAACRRYPRHPEEYGARREWSLSLSCPAVVDLVLNQKAPIEFIEKELPKTARPEEEVEPALVSALLTVRDTAIRISQDRTLPLGVRMAVVLAMTHDVQYRLGAYENRPRLASAASVLEKYRLAVTQKSSRLFRHLDSCRVDSRRQEQRLARMFDLLWELPSSCSRWNECLSRMNFWDFRKIPESDGENIAEERSLIRYEHLLVTYLDLYLLGAAYDDDVFTKAKLAVYHCLMLKQMEERLRKGLPEFLHIYAREVEHEERNLEYLEKKLASKKEFDLNTFISCLLPPAE